jgi:hypothetical protein
LGIGRARRILLMGMTTRSFMSWAGCLESWDRLGWRSGSLASARAQWLRKSGY